MAGRRMIDDLQLYNIIFYSVARMYTNNRQLTRRYYMTYTLVLFGKEFRLNNVHIILHIVLLFHAPSITVDSHRAGAVV